MNSLPPSQPYGGLSDVRRLDAAVGQPRLDRRLYRHSQGQEHFPGQSGVCGPGVGFHLHALEVLSLGISHFYCRDYRTHVAPYGALILFSSRAFCNSLLSIRV